MAQQDLRGRSAPGANVVCDPPRRRPELDGDGDDVANQPLAWPSCLANGEDTRCTRGLVNGLEADGKDWSLGYVWRGDTVTDEYYVQNGNLRNDDGRVTTEQTLPPYIDECGIDNVLCHGVVVGGCAVGGLYAIAACTASAGALCLAASTLAAECGIEGGDALAGCRQWASEGKCA